MGGQIQDSGRSKDLALAVPLDEDCLYCHISGVNLKYIGMHLPSPCYCFNTLFDSLSLLIPGSYPGIVVSGRVQSRWGVGCHRTIIQRRRFSTQRWRKCRFTTWAHSRCTLCEQDFSECSKEKADLDSETIPRSYWRPSSSWTKQFLYWKELVALDGLPCVFPELSGHCDFHSGKGWWLHLKPKYMISW